jgi:hypothetical protein
MRVVLSFFLILVFGARMIAQPASAPETTGEIIKLPAYPVRGDITLRKPEAWKHAQLGDFEVLSQASEKATKEFTTSFWRFQAVFQDLFPLVKNLPQLPLTLVLCSSHDKFDELVRNASTGTTGRSSYFATDADQGVIVVDLQPRVDLAAPGMSGADLIAANSGGDDMSSLEADPTQSAALNSDQLLDREYIHFMLSRFTPRPPVWFAEGLAQLYSRLGIDKDTYQFGNLDAALGHYFTQRQMMPLEKFFAVSYDSPEFLQPINGMFPAESLAFVHFCLYRGEGKYQKPLFELVRRAGREPITEKIFKEVFNLDYTDMLIKLRGYVDGVTYTSKSVALPHPLVNPTTELREATDAEVGRIKGDTLRLGSRLTEARVELLSPYLRGNSDARLLASIGLLDRTEKNDPIAKKYLGMAATSKVALPGPYIYLAEMRFAELTAPGTPPLTPAQASELFQLLGAAGAMPPPRADVYRLLAEIWLHTDVPPTPQNLVVLDGAVRAFPRDSVLVYSTAQAKLRAGAKNEAGTLADLGLRFATTADTKRQFTELKAKIAH